MHGLASNDELLTLLTLSIGLSSLFGMLVGILVFSLGVVGGVVLFSFLMNFPVVKSGQKIQLFLLGGSGLASIGYGLFILW